MSRSIRTLTIQTVDVSPTAALLLCLRSVMAQWRGSTVVIPDPSQGAIAQIDRSADIAAPVSRPSRTERIGFCMRRRVSSILRESWRSGKTVATSGDDRRTSLVKIKNPKYSQMEGREELFER